MAASTITRDTWTNDSGTPLAPVGDGTLIGNTQLQNHIYARIDAMFAGAGAYATLALGGLLAVEGFGTHAFSAGGTGGNSIRLRNTTAGTGNFAVLELGNDAVVSAATLYAMSSTYTTGGSLVQDACVLQGVRVGGISIAATHGTGAIRFYSGGENERAVLNNNGLRLQNGYYLGWKDLAGTETRVLTLHTDNNVFLDAPVASSNLILRTNQSFVVTEVARLTSNGAFLIGDNSNASNLRGLTINNLDADDEILSLKSTGIAHGYTAVTEPDTYARFAKISAANGGLAIHAFTDAGTGIALQLVGGQETADVAKSTAADGAVVINGTARAATTWGTLGTNGNIVAFQDNGTTRFILDADGDSHMDVGTAWTNYDQHDDLALLNRLSAHVTRLDDPLRASFGAWLLTRRDELEHLKLVTFNEDGHHFLNTSRLLMLLTGAVRQMGAKVAQLEQKALHA